MAGTRPTILHDMPVRTSRVGKIQIELSREQVARLLVLFAALEDAPMPPAQSSDAAWFDAYLERRAVRRWGTSWRPAR